VQPPDIEFTKMAAEGVRFDGPRREEKRSGREEKRREDAVCTGEGSPMTTRLHTILDRRLARVD
jgi:hypothetical protein